MSPLINLRCTKTISRLGMAIYILVLLASVSFGHVVGEADSFFNDTIRPVALGTTMGELWKADLKIAAPLFANKSTVKHATWSDSCRL